VVRHRFQPAEGEGSWPVLPGSEPVRRGTRFGASEEERLTEAGAVERKLTTAQTSGHQQ
jgi:hypothetical protein